MAALPAAAAVPLNVAFEIPNNCNRVAPAVYVDWSCPLGNIDWCKIIVHSLLILIPTGFPLVLLSIKLNEQTEPMEKAICAYFLIFVVILMILGIVLLQITDEDSISGMVAQRFNKVSYFIIIVIVLISSYSSCFILSNGIATQNAEGYSFERVWTTILASLSPLISSGILIFPLLVEKHISEINFIPLQVQMVNNKYPLRFFKPFPSWMHKALHYVSIVCGLVLGYTTIIYNIDTTEYSREHTFKIVLTSGGLAFTLCFFIPIFFDIEDESIGKKRFLLWLEFLGLYAYMLLLIYISMLSGVLV